MNSNIDVIKGRIEAFEFAARQFRVYASDNDTLHQRYNTKGKAALAVAQKRSQTWRDAAEDCERHAAEQKKDLAALEADIIKKVC